MIFYALAPGSASTSQALVQSITIEGKGLILNYVGNGTMHLLSKEKPN